MARRSGFVTFLLVVSIIGALNWGLVGFFNWNLVNALFGGDKSIVVSGLSRIIYAIVGLSGLGLAFMMPRLQGPLRAAEETGRREPPRRRPEPPQPQA
jgi:uncharacterized membrane protein YuzA (DUF378 family)